MAEISREGTRDGGFQDPMTRGTLGEQIQAQEAELIKMRAFSIIIIIFVLLPTA
jgi:hypothetical protein